MNRGRLLAVAMLGPVACLPGCSGTVQSAFGLDKRAPDEFQVVRRAPLIVPPDVTLRPPEPGTVGPAQPSPAAEAREVLTGSRAAPTDRTMSSAEEALVAEAPGPADPDIRSKLLDEGTQLVALDRGSYLMILDWQQRALEPAPDVIDPQQEYQRLREDGYITTTRVGSATAEAGNSQ